MSINNEALSHAWQWFEYHAKQRMILIRYYIVIAGAISVGVFTLVVKQYDLEAALFSAFGALSAICFWRLDTRTADLVKLGEAALMRQQGKLASEIGDEFRICERADSEGKRRWWWPYSYKESFRWLFLGIFTLFLIQCCASLGEYLSTHRF